MVYIQIYQRYKGKGLGISPETNESVLDGFEFYMSSWHCVSPRNNDYCMIFTTFTFHIRS